MTPGTRGTGLHRSTGDRATGDRATKRLRVLALLDRSGSERMVLTSAGAVSWYLDGTRSVVRLSAERAVVAVVVDRDGDTVLAPNNEADRMVEEELPPDVAVRVVDWWAPLLGPDLAPGSPGVLHEDEPAAHGLQAARAALLPGETGRYRELGRDTAEAMTAAALSAGPGLSEREVASRLGAELLARGADPLVLLVAGAQRLAFRHALPTQARLGRRAMLVVCARRHGLIANATRWVSFEPLTTAEAEAHRRIRAVETAFLRASRPGTTLGEVFDAGVCAYAEHGFPPDEWTRHHQGGPTGYAGRDPVAVPGSPLLLVEDQALAWNPSAPGVKAEDTVRIAAAGVEVLTADDRWPCSVDAMGLRRPDVLVR